MHVYMYVSLRESDVLRWDKPQPNTFQYQENDMFLYQDIDYYHWYILYYWQTKKNITATLISLMKKKLRLEWNKEQSTQQRILQVISLLL